MDLRKEKSDSPRGVSRTAQTPSEIPPVSQLKALSEKLRVRSLTPASGVKEVKEAIDNIRKRSSVPPEPKDGNEVADSEEQKTDAAEEMPDTLPAKGIKSYE